jgi:hypothetical protein
MTASPRAEPFIARKFDKVLSCNHPAKVFLRGIHMFRMAFAAFIMSASLVAVFSPADAQQRQVQVGQLTCSVSASVGLVVGSQKNVNCVFRGQPGEPEEAILAP